MPTDKLPRYCPSLLLPPYSYVPGLSPHPTSDERGHSFGRREPLAPPLDPHAYRQNETYAYALDLFNHGFYWEAHEAWEALWHACGRRGATADFLKGLIKLAAAGVKAREGRPSGVRRHAMRAKELFDSAEESNSAAARDRTPMYGLLLSSLMAAAQQLAERAEELAGDGPDAQRRLPLVLRM